MFGFKSSSKNKRKPAKNPTPSLSTSSETKHFPNIPSVSQIAPLPQNKSHSILPVLSLDGRDAPSSIQSEESENDLTSITTMPNNENGRHSVGVYTYLQDLLILFHLQSLSLLLQ
ncbi:unnamed protein product [Rotaria socialis]|uniref:Uncharacterized protein n=1 Tax=Rotaria socialis TaxID=392032 RepID=A0A821ATY6_9BILA|nr:unnamed protein product [Rotaria socialis]CAF4582883.1 unnamed protein product [Rotaria socialis]